MYANLFIEGDRVVYEKPHTHAPDPIKAKKIQIQANIKTETKNTNKSANAIIMNIITHLEDEETAIIPKIKNIKDSIRKKRNKIIGYLDRDFTDIPEHLKYDQRGELFMQFDSGHGDHERFIIFFTNFKSCFFRTTKTLLIDATFRITLQGFYQVLILHGTFLDKA
ncbi:hypothetical protein CDIK_3151 [Cucumispora dikerogammari]|nr:hypothetical protein CDIK_3151 [Cucumispora dikerogammari]